MRDVCGYCNGAGRIPVPIAEGLNKTCPKCDGAGMIGRAIELPPMTPDEAMRVLRELQWGKP